MKKLALAVLLGLVLGVLLNKTVHAQSAIPWQVAVGGAHTLCTVTTGVTQYCFASDGLYVSLAGAAYTQLGVAGTPGVISVNGKTGIVTISGITVSTTTSTTTLN